MKKYICTLLLLTIFISMASCSKTNMADSNKTEENDENVIYTESVVTEDNVIENDLTDEYKDKEVITLHSSSIPTVKVSKEDEYMLMLSYDVDKEIYFM